MPKPARSFRWRAQASRLYRPDGSLITQTFTYPEVTTIDTFYTNSDGYLITPEKLEYGTGYSLVEVSAPYGYTLNSEPVYFDVTADNATEENAVTVVEVTKAEHGAEGRDPDQQERRGIFFRHRGGRHLSAGVCGQGACWCGL